MDQTLKCKGLSNKTFKRKLGVNLHDLGFGNRFLNMTPKTQTTKEYRYIGLHQN